MIDERFSADSFARLGLDSKESRELADLLEKETTKEMQLVIEAKFKELIEKLNSMGHDLRPEYDSSPGDISYRDDHENGKYSCKLRLGFDFVTSSGYAHLIDPDDELD